MKSANHADIQTNLKAPLPSDASRGPKKVPFKTTVARARSKIFNAFGGVKTATRPGPHNDSRLESCQDVGRNSTRSVIMRPSDDVDTSTVTNHQSNDEGHSSGKSTPVDVVMVFDNELHEWWGPSLTSGNLLVDGVREETHMHNNKALPVRYNQQQALALLALTI